jgi:hypothetical protein
MKWSTTHTESKPTASAACAVASRSDQRADPPANIPWTCGNTMPTLSGLVRLELIRVSGQHSLVRRGVSVAPNL